MSRSTSSGRKRRRRGPRAGSEEGGETLPGALSAIFTGDLAAYRDTFVVGDVDRPSLPAARLLRSGVFDDVLAPFVARYPGADRRAVVSFWTQWYFSALVVPSVAVSLTLDHQLPLAIDDVTLLLDSDEHRPAGFRLPHGGHALDADTGPFARFRGLVRRHLEPFVDAVAGHTGLASRLLWSNAGSYFDWIVRTLEDGRGEYGTSPAGSHLLGARTWPDGRDNPLFEPVRPVDRDGVNVRQRRICCLRYLLPGVEGCGERCPLAG